MNGAHEPNPDSSHPESQTPRPAAPVRPPAPAMMAAPGPIPRDPRSKSPVLASFLSLLPGLGQVYVGYYRRGFIHALVAAGVFSLLVGMNDFTPLHPLGIIFLIFFVLYNIIDAGRRATLYNLHLAGAEDTELPKDFEAPSIGGSFLGGVTLIVVGGILLGYTRFGMSLEWIESWWPLAPILFGVYLLGKAIQERAAEGKD